jgi:hypothetical protein
MVGTIADIFIRTVDPIDKIFHGAGHREQVILTIIKEDNMSVINSPDIVLTRETDRIVCESKLVVLPAETPDDVIGLVIDRHC